LFRPFFRKKRPKRGIYPTVCRTDVRQTAVLQKMREKTREMVLVKQEMRGGGADGRRAVGKGKSEEVSHPLKKQVLANSRQRRFSSKGFELAAQDGKITHPL